MNAKEDSMISCLSREFLRSVLNKAPDHRVKQLTDEIAMAHRGHFRLPQSASVMDPVINLKILNFLTMELAEQLAHKREDTNKSSFDRVMPDTVLHEEGVRHDPFICQHCSSLRSTKGR